MKTLINIIDWFNDHKALTITVTAIWFVMTIVLNTAFEGKPLPITGQILQTWMAYINVISVSSVCGIIWGFISFKK